MISSDSPRSSLRIVTPALLLSVGLALGCDILGPDLDGRGTIRFLDLEGGCWGILTDEDLYEPVNLDARFRIDGMRVDFEAKLRKDMASPCMIGPMIELTKINAVGV